MKTRERDRTRPGPLATDPDRIRLLLARLDRAVHVIAAPAGPAVSLDPVPGRRVLATLGPLPPRALGSPDFRAAHGTDTAYMAGGMAGAISSVGLVAAAARAGFLAVFGAGGLTPDAVRSALVRLGTRLPARPYAVSLLHTPTEQALERSVVELFLNHGVRCVEASAYLDLTPHLVRYRVAGLRRGPDGRAYAGNRVIAKASRPEVCGRFLLPPPEDLVAGLLAQGLITAEQAGLAREMPMADDLTVEADSAGHTDRRPLSALLPVVARQRDELHRRHPNLPLVRLGAAGGIGTPRAVAAALALGADYVVTGSVNQACVEAGTAERTRRLLATAGVSDFDMAPSGYQFELGAQVQVLRRGTMFPQRARRLRRMYESCGGLEELTADDRAWLEGQIFRRPLEEVWAEVVGFFAARDPGVVERAAADPKRRMALTFRWYLGLSSKWAVTGDPERAADYQIWAGPALGGFNDWVRDTYLAEPGNRRIADVAHHLLYGAAFHTRAAALQHAGVRLPAGCLDYVPAPLS
ncbi:PfaD family polyunsaturated fatty acid/polyketide biosynthesis protein [Streptomyces sp. NPDC026206]|uniref:PfaD family polyunsaturated fatty acid/polyketide biosynthesis protein n=1 Tax=Streptomyces sp. NPDC026206 TaxID=3157089 RepID=UPI0033FE38A5